MIRDTNMYRGRIHIPGVAAARSGARRRPNLKRQLGFMHRLPSLRGDSCFCPCGTRRQSFPAEVCRTSSTFAGRVPRRETQQYVATPNKQLSPHGVSPIRPPATSDLERGSRGSRRRYIEVKAFGLVASRAAIMTGTRCRSRDTLVAVATLRWKLLKDWCRRKRRQAFPPRFLTLPLLADFLGHTKNIAGGEMDSSHGHAVDVEIRVSPVPDGEGGSWRILGPRRSVTGFAAGFAERNWQRLRFRMSRPMASAAVIGRLSSVGLGAPV